MPYFTIPVQAPSRITIESIVPDPFTKKLEASAQLCPGGSSQLQGAAFPLLRQAQSTLSAPDGCWPCSEKHFSSQWQGRKYCSFGLCRDIFTHMLVQKLDNEHNCFVLVFCLFFTKESAVKLSPEWEIVGEIICFRSLKLWESGQNNPNDSKKE